MCNAQIAPLHIVFASSALVRAPTLVLHAVIAALPKRICPAHAPNTLQRMY